LKRRKLFKLFFFNFTCYFTTLRLSFNFILKTRMMTLNLEYIINYPKYNKIVSDKYRLL